MRFFYVIQHSVPSNLYIISQILLQFLPPFRTNLYIKYTKKILLFNNIKSIFRTNFGFFQTKYSYFEPKKALLLFVTGLFIKIQEHLSVIAIFTILVPVPYLHCSACSEFLSFCPCRLLRLFFFRLVHRPVVRLVLRLDRHLFRLRRCRLRIPDCPW